MKYKIKIEELTYNESKGYDDTKTVYEQVVEGENETLIVDVISVVNKLV